MPLIGAIARSDRYPAFPSNVQFGDIVKGLPVPDDYCEGIYCSHVLEHLSLQDCRQALQNTYRYLRPGGIFRLVMPDLRSLARTYVEDMSPTASIQFMQRSYLGKAERTRSIVGFLRSWLGNSEHFWMWDYVSMKAELERIGFRDVRRAQFGDSSDQLFHDVEEEKRWFQLGPGDTLVPCLGIECRK